MEIVLFIFPLNQSLGDENVAKLLINSGAAVNRNDNGFSALHSAAEKGSFWLYYSNIECIKIYVLHDRCNGMLWAF